MSPGMSPTGGLNRPAGRRSRNGHALEQALRERRVRQVERRPRHDASAPSRPAAANSSATSFMFIPASVFLVGQPVFVSHPSRP